MLAGTVLWFVLCAVVGWVASQKGRSAIGFFFLALFLSPIVGFIVVMVVRDKSETGDADASFHRDDKTCPYCAERIKAAAVVCKHCGKDLSRAAGGEAGITEEQIAALQRRAR